jgi:nucleoside-diphosphate-sugar epimerase
VRRTDVQILLTGANGFIGRHLAQRLDASPHTTCGLIRPGSVLGTLSDLPRLERRLGDVLSPESLVAACEGVDVVVHLAGAVAAGRDATYHRVNVEGAAHLADAARVAGVKRVVFVSSLAAQGPSPRGVPHIDSGNEAPSNEYGRTKLEAERALVERLGPERVTVLRPALVFGPDQPDLPRVAKALTSRVMPVVSGLELSFVHVSDLADLIAAAVEVPGEPGRAYFVSDGRVLTMERVIDCVEQALAKGPAMRLALSGRLLSALKPLADRLTNAAGMGASVARVLGELNATGWACAPDRAAAHFGFAPKTTLESALPALVEWYRSRGWLDGRGPVPEVSSL